MPYKPSQIFGADVFALTPPQLRQRARTIPRVSQRWQARTPDAFAIGDAFPDSGEISGIEHMRIVEIDPEIEIPDEACELALTGEGIPSGDTWMELDRQNQSPDVGWDQIGLGIYTRDLTEARWAKGERLKKDTLTGIAATASTDVLTKVAHGLVTGQLLEDFTFGAGFAGLTSGDDYFVIVLDADTFKLATTRANAEAGTAIDITTDGTGATATPLVFGHELMFITGKQDRPADAKDYHHLDLELKGLLMRDGDSKPIVRTWDTAGNKSTSKFDGYALLTGDIYEGFPPVDSGSNATLSGTGISVEYDVPQVRVTDTMVTTTQPQADWLYQFWQPENAPTVTLFSLSAAEYTYRFPFGWKLASMNVQEIPGKQVWLLSLTWEKLPATIATTTTATA